MMLHLQCTDIYFGATLKGAPSDRLIFASSPREHEFFLLGEEREAERVRERERETR